MVNSVSDMSLHLWVRAANFTIGTSRRYGVCGVHIGRFVSKVEEVTCEGCLDIIKAKERSEPAQPVSQ